MGEVLIPAIALVDGDTIVQLAVDSVTYWHVEPDGHDILLAENLPAESYLEMGNRGFFAEAEAVALHARPDAPTRAPTPTSADRSSIAARCSRRCARASPAISAAPAAAGWCRRGGMRERPCTHLA